MDLKDAGISLDSLIASFNARIVELQELVLARNSTPCGLRIPPVLSRFCSLPSPLPAECSEKEDTLSLFSMLCSVSGHQHPGSGRRRHDTEDDGVSNPVDQGSHKGGERRHSQGQGKVNFLVPSVSCSACVCGYASRCFSLCAEAHRAVSASAAEDPAYAHSHAFADARQREPSCRDPFSVKIFTVASKFKFHYPSS